MKSLKTKLYLLLLILCTFSSLDAQVYINEVCSSNENSFITNTGDTPDWIEFYNSGDVLVNLHNYYLSDGESNFFKWQFPAVSIAPDEYLLLFASGDDTIGELIHTNFRLAESGETLTFSSSTGDIIQQILLPPLAEDISYSRDTNSAFFYSNSPTPGYTNDNSNQINRAQKPSFNITKAFFQDSFYLELNCSEPNCQIYYSIDGSRPTENSSLYSNPIQINKNSIIRAFTEAEGYLSSRVESKNYFSSVPHDMPVIALSTNPHNLFDYENGIFETGPDAEDYYPYWGANYWKDIEIPVHIEFLDGNFTRLSNFDLGARTHGGRGTRTHPQKALRLLAEHKYGDNKIEQKLFPERENSRFERIVLRNAGGDFNHSHCRDEYLARYLLRENLDLDIINYQPAAWYINGVYWGIIALREKFDEHWIEQNYGIAINNIDLLEEDTITVTGNREIFEEDYAFVLDNNMLEETAFQEAANRFDIKNMADYFVTQTTISNSNWPHNNLKLWRERVPNGKWRYMIFDMDVSMNRWAWTAAETSILKEKLDNTRFVSHTQIFTSLLKNKGYKEYFINRYADLLNTTFRPEIWSASVKNMQAEISNEMERHFARWTGCENCNSFEFWEESAMPNMIDFSNKRAGFARKEIQDYFILENEVLLDLRTYPENAGKIKINTITPENLPWDGYYFNGNPIELTIIPNPGFTFRHWQSLKTIQSPLSENSIKINFEEDDSITAYFSNDYQGLNISSFPIPTSDITNLVFTLDQISDIKITIFAADGREIDIVFSKQLTGGTHYIPIDLSNWIPGIYFARISTNKENQSVKIIKTN